MTLIYHVAIADDWEAAVAFGSYEAATRGVLYQSGEPIRAVTADGVQRVLDHRYQDLLLPLLLLVLDADALEAAGVAVDRGPGDAARIGGPLPPGDASVVRAVIPLRRDRDRWLTPDLSGGGTA